MRHARLRGSAGGPSPPRPCGPRARGRSARSGSRRSRGRRRSPRPVRAPDEIDLAAVLRGVRVDRGGPLSPAYAGARRSSSSVQLTAKRGCTATREPPVLACRETPPRRRSVSASPSSRRGAQVRRRRLRVVHQDVAARVADARRAPRPRRARRSGGRCPCRARRSRPAARHSERPRRAETAIVAASWAASPGQTCVCSHGSSSRSSGPFRRSVWQRCRCACTKPGRSHLPRASSRSTGSPAAAAASRRACSRRRADRSVLGVEVRRGPDVPAVRQAEQCRALDEQAAHGVLLSRQSAYSHRQAAQNDDRAVVAVRLAGGVLLLDAASAGVHERTDRARPASSGTPSSGRARTPRPPGCRPPVMPSV